MFAKFQSLNPEKQDRILNAAMKEFARKGYANASTNEIVKEAEISKGLLFHYFTNKKQLFLYLYDYGVELTIRNLYEKLNRDESDLFARIRHISRLKLEILNQHPEIFRFIEVAYIEDSSAIRQELDKRNKELLGNHLHLLFDGIDYSRFREGVDIQKAMKIIMWTFEGYGKEEMLKAKAQHAASFDYEKMLAETDQYIELFKICFYK